VAEVFGKLHKNVIRDIDNLECTDNFKRLNFELKLRISNLGSGRTRQDPYYEMTKDGFSFLVMGYTGAKAAEFKELFINEFNKRGNMLTDDEYILQKSREILENRVLQLKKRLELTTGQVELQNKTIAEQAPKVMYHDEVLQSEATILTNVIAKELGMSAMALNKILHSKRIIYRQGDTWVLYAKYQNLGYTKTKTVTYHDSRGEVKTNIQTVWTEKGRKFIHDLVK
jgi:Rha family phage regulatory protein